MTQTSIYTMFQQLSLVMVLSMISAKTVRADCPNTVCRTQTNDCGMPYGGCYDNCAGQFTQYFTAPDCTPTDTATATTTTATDSVITPSADLRSAGTSSACIPQSICVDKIDACFHRYGGCYDANACDGIGAAAITSPACVVARAASGFARMVRAEPTAPANNWKRTTTKASKSHGITPAPTKFSTAVRQACTPNTVCYDAINSCGVRYGGCYDTCSGAATDLFPAPPCTTSRPVV
ncbi:hypothetical protein BJ546DRAFT_252332 [Cryomyces antarcticus]